MSDSSVTITVTRSAGDDRAALVFIDTDFEPDGSDGGPGLRIRLNDEEVFVGVAIDNEDADHPGASKTFTVSLSEVPYLGIGSALLKDGPRPDCGPDATTWFGRGQWPTCKCGFAPRDNAVLNAHWWQQGFKVVDHHGQLVKHPISEED